MLENKFNQLCLSPSDINEHLPTIKKYAEECETIVELGVRIPISTFALMMGKPKKLTSVDILHPNHFGGGYELELVYEYAKQENIEKHEFKKGESGNPNGRPKGAKNRSTIAKYWLEVNQKLKNPLTNQEETMSQEDCGRA